MKSDLSPAWAYYLFGWNRIGDIAEFKVLGFAYFRIGVFKAIYIPFRDKPVFKWGWSDD